VTNATRAAARPGLAGFAARVGGPDSAADGPPAGGYLPTSDAAPLGLHDRYVRLVGRRADNLLAAFALAAVLTERRND
jgi:hypothetical protein